MGRKENGPCDSEAEEVFGPETGGRACETRFEREKAHDREREKKRPGSSTNVCFSYLEWLTKSFRARAYTFTGEVRFPPGLEQKPEEFAQQYFSYHMNNTDHVICSYCWLVLGEWEKGDGVAAAHQQYSEHCPVVLGEVVEGISH